MRSRIFTASFLCLELAPFSMHTNMASQSQAQSLTSQIRPWFGYQCQKEPGCKCGGLFHDSLILAGLEHQWFDGSEDFRLQ